MTTTKRHQSRHHDDEEMQEPVAEPVEAPKEVADRAAAPGQQSISVTANKPETLETSPLVAPLGEVIEGASNDKDVPPSLLGTSYAPKQKE